MRNPHLEKAILNALHVRPCGAKGRTLRAETEELIDNRLVTTIEFDQALERLVDAEMVIRETTMLGDELYSISPLGEQALKEG